MSNIIHINEAGPNSRYTLCGKAANCYGGPKGVLINEPEKATCPKCLEVLERLNREEEELWREIEEYEKTYPPFDRS